MSLRLNVLLCSTMPRFDGFENSKYFIIHVHLMVSCMFMKIVRKRILTVKYVIGKRLMIIELFGEQKNYDNYWERSQL